MEQSKRFELHDRLWKIGFASGLDERVQRSRIIDGFIDRFYEERPYFERWLEIAEGNDAIRNKGAFLRAQVSMGKIPDVFPKN